MNVVMLSRSLPFHRLGGMERVAWDLATGLAARNHNVWLMTTAISDERAYSIPPHLVGRLTVDPVFNTRPGRYSRSWWMASRHAFLAKRDSFRPDVLISISISAASVLPVRGPIPAIIQVHGTFLSEFKSKIRTIKMIPLISAVRNLFWIPKESRAYWQIQRIVAVGPAVVKMLRHPLYRAPADRIVLIPNGVDTELFSPKPQRKPAFRERLGIPSGAKVLIWASRLQRDKGTHFALEGFATLKTRNLWFFIIGDGPERRNLERQAQDLGISERVLFTGQVNHDRLPEWLNVGDVFVFTSTRNEGFPLNILEAMSMDLPVVVSKELYGPLEGAHGVYPVNPTDIEDVRKAMESAISSKGGGRPFIIRHYSKDVMIDRYEELLERLVKANG